MAVAKISYIYLKKQRFWNNGTCILPEICRFWVQNVKLGKKRLRNFHGLKKMLLEPKFEVIFSKNKEMGQLCNYQNIWKIALLHQML